EEVDVAVAEYGAGRRLEFFGTRQPDGGGGALPGRGSADARAQPRGVREQLANGDGLLAVALEFGEVAIGRRIQINLAALEQQHYGRRTGKDLCERSGVENRILRHRLLFWRERSAPVTPAVDAAISLKPEHRARQAFLGDGVGDGEIHLSQFRGIE